MITKNTAPSATRHAGVAALALLSLGALIFYSLPPRTTPPTSALTDAEGPFATNEGRPVHPDLETLHIEMKSKAAAAVVNAKRRAVREGVLIARAKDMVSATARMGDKTAKVRLRLKGDWLDHVSTDRWSMRIEVQKGALAGMSAFSVQHPETRGVIREWMIMQAARSEGLLAPRCTFVNVVVNGRCNGIYYLEEHFTKELLESNGRRDGPILKFSEDSLWRTLRQHGVRQGVSRELSAAVGMRAMMMGAEISAYGEKRLGKDPKLNRSLQRGLEQMRDVQRLALDGQPSLPIGGTEAHEELGERTLDDLFVAKKVGIYFAICSVFRATHGLSWQQMRFYRDPVLDRLEPIMFDACPAPNNGWAELGVLIETQHGLGRSNTCYEASFDAMARVTRPEWFANYSHAIASDYRRFGNALRSDPEFEHVDLERILAGIKANCERIRAIVTPQKVAIIAGSRSEPDNIEIEAIATTRVPVRIDSFVTADGQRVPAANALAPGYEHHRRSGGHAVLTRMPDRARFTIGGSPGTVEVVFAAITAEEPTRSHVAIDPSLTPASPAASPVGRDSLASLLDKHPFLSFDVAAKQIIVPTGTWRADEDITVPDGLAFVLGPGSQLQLDSTAHLRLRGPLVVVGSREHPAHIEPAPGADSFGGITVRHASDKSQLLHARVRGARELTFARCDVEVTDTEITPESAATALRLVASHFNLTRVTLDGGSTLFEGRAVSGTILDTTLRRSSGHGLILGHSQVRVVRSVFSEIAGRAISEDRDSVILTLECEGLTR